MITSIYQVKLIRASLITLAALIVFVTPSTALASLNPSVLNGVAPVAQNGLRNSNNKITPLHEAELQRLFPEGEHPYVGPLEEIAGQISEKLKTVKKAVTSFKTLTKIFPIIEWLPPYIRTQWKRSLLNDISAGVVIGIMLVPQAIAYSMVASLPPQYGYLRGLFFTSMYFC